jgi:hypothetical protein
MLMRGHLKEEATAGGEDAAEEGFAAQPLYKQINGRRLN